MRVLVVNAGSSSVKLSVLDGDRAAGSTAVDAPGGRADPGRVDEAVGALTADGVDAVGHRVVHGGDRFDGPVRVDDGVLHAIEELAVLAPLHQPPAVAAVRAVRAALPGAPAVACFDTAFHAGLPAAASTYAVPVRWRELGVRRYGFHGLAHEWASGRAAELLGRPVGELRTVVAHLGSGASLCAVDGGRSVDTTMGFTPTAGLVMGTRSGDLDPAVPLWLVRRGLGVDEVADGLDRASGLLGLAGSADAAEVVAAAERGEDDAVLALDVWVHRTRALVAAMVAALGGLDVLVFSGGVGERAAGLRRRVVDGLGFLGLAIRPAAAGPADADLTADGADEDLTADGAAARTLVVRAREDVVIARQVRAVLR